MAAFDTTPIVLVRNIFDAIESRCRSEQTNSHSAAYRIPVDLESCVYRFAFEHLSFVRQWSTVCRKAEWPMLRFEDNVTDWPNAIRRAVAALGVPFDEHNAVALIERYKIRSTKQPADFRIGSGERAAFPAFLVEHVSRVARCFSESEVTKDLEPFLQPR